MKEDSSNDRQPPEQVEPAAGHQGTQRAPLNRSAVEGEGHEQVLIDALSHLVKPLAASEGTFADLTQAVLEQAKRLTKSEHGYVSVVDPKTGDNIGHTLTDWMAGECRVRGADHRIVFPRGPDGEYLGLWGHGLQDGIPFFTNSPANHPSVRGAPSGHVPLANFLSYPVVIGDRLLGQIALANAPLDYTDRDIDRIGHLAEVYALAIQHKHVDEELRIKQAAIAGSITAIAIADPEGRLTYTNQAFLDFWGYTRQDDVIGMGSTDFWSNKEDAERVMLALRDKGSWTGDLLAKRRDGNEFQVHLATSVVNSPETGEPLCIYASFVDMTGRKNTEQALIASETRYRHIFDAAPVAIWVEDLSALKKELDALRKSGVTDLSAYLDAHPEFVEEAGRLVRVLDVNEASLALYSAKTKQDLLGPVCRVFTPRSVPAIKEILTAILERRPHLAIETENRTLDGRDIDVILHVDLPNDEAGFERVLLSTVDITDFRRVEANLRESEEQFRSLAEQSPNMIFIHQMGRVVYANRKCEEVMGYDREEFYSPDFDFMTLIASESQELIKEAYRRHRRGEDIPPYEYVLITKDGCRIDALINSKLTLHRGKQAILGIVTDITHRKQLQEEVLRAQKLESVGILAGGIAHDFNNILTGIAGNLSLARMILPPDDSLAEYLDQAQKATIHAQDLTHQLLTFSKGGAPVRKVLDPNTLIREAMRFALSGTNVLGSFDVSDDLWLIEADRGQLMQVFNNLAINAVQAMPRGGTIHIEARNVAFDTTTEILLDTGKYVRVSLTDEGLGIPEGHLSKIFDPYFITKQKGSGLGLAVAYSIIKNHGGHISAESQLGIGSTFTLYLPIGEQSLGVSDQLGEGTLRGHGRILLMDDEEIVRRVGSAILEKLGYEAVLASDGQKAIELYQEALDEGRPFDAVIMDLTVAGGLGGTQAVTRLREIDPKARVVVSSGYSNDSIMANYQEFGFDGVLAKPYRVVDLAAVLERLLNRTETQ